MPNRLTVLFVPAVIVLVLAGCSASTSGTPISTTTVGPSTDPGQSTPNPPTSGPENRYGAPRVENPLDATRYLTEPCAAISPRLQQSLKLPGQGEPDTTSAVGRNAPSCRWSSLATVANGEAVSVGFLKGNKNGLADLYHQHEYFNDHKYWDETTVEGYPAVFYDTIDRRSAGQCDIAVGVNDSLAMVARETGKLGAGSCDRAKEVAAAVIQTVKGRG